MQNEEKNCLIVQNPDHTGLQKWVRPFVEMY